MRLILGILMLVNLFVLFFFLWPVFIVLTNIVNNCLKFFKNIIPKKYRISAKYVCCKKFAQICNLHLN